MKHILFELRECPSKLLDDTEFVIMALQVAASRAKSKLINVNFHNDEVSIQTRYHMYVKN